MAVGHTIAGIALAVWALTNSQWYLLCLVAIGLGCGAARTGPFAFSHTLARPTGQQENGRDCKTGSQTSRVLVPALTGFLVDRTGKFLAPLAIAAAVLVAGGLAWVFAVGPVEHESWESESGEAPGATASF